MGEFQLPENGSVLIIDENIDEAMPLIKLLSKQGIASVYLSGKESEMPEKPFTKIRLAFIDIQLYGPTDPESHAQTIIRILDTVIPENNGPYIAIIWTTTSQTNVDVLTEKLKSADNGPVAVFPLSKSLYFQRTMDDSRYDRLLEQIDPILETRFEQEDLDAIKALVRDNIDPETKMVFMDDGLTKITDELREKLEKYDTFHLFTFWENIINKASGEIVSNFSKLYPTDDYWQDNLKTGIFRLAHAQLGKNIISADIYSIISNALKTLNQMFVETIENNTYGIEVNNILSIDQDAICVTEHIVDKKYQIKWKVHKKEDTFQLYINDTLFPPGSPGKARIDEISKNIPDPNDKARTESLIKKFKSIVPKINTKLLINNVITNILQPGNVYERKIRKIDRKKELIKSYFKEKAILDNEGNLKLTDVEVEGIIFIELEVTPLCDFAQNKWIKSRLLPGILIPDGLKAEVSQADSIYNNIPEIEHRGKLYKPIFNFNLVKSCDFDKLKSKKSLFRIKTQLFTDILNKLSSHISRVGITCVQ